MVYSGWHRVYRNSVSGNLYIGDLSFASKEKALSIPLINGKPVRNNFVGVIYISGEVDLYKLPDPDNQGDWV